MRFTPAFERTGSYIFKSFDGLHSTVISAKSSISNLSFAVIITLASLFGLMHDGVPPPMYKESALSFFDFSIS